MDPAEERDQALSHMEKAMGAWAGVNEAVQLGKASSHWHQEPTALHSAFSCLPLSCTEPLVGSGLRSWARNIFSPLPSSPLS